MGSHSLLQGIFLTQWSNPSLLHCRQILYRLEKWKWKWSRSVLSNSLWPVDCSPPSSSIHRILQARILKWVAIPFSRACPRHNDRTQVFHIAGSRFNLCATREALKYKNTVSQKTSYRDTELQIQVLTSKISKGGKEARLKEEGGGGRRGGERGGLTNISCHLQIPRHYGTFPCAFREGRTGTRPYQKSEPEFEFSAKRRWSVSNPQLRLRALRPDSCIQDQGTRKTGKDRKG